MIINLNQKATFYDRYIHTVVIFVYKWSFRATLKGIFIQFIGI